MAAAASRRKNVRPIIRLCVLLVALLAASTGCTSSTQKGALTNPLASGPAAPPSNSQPSMAAKIGSSVAAVPQKVADSVKSGATTVKNFILPQPHPAAAPTVIASSASEAEQSKPGPDLYVASARLCERNGDNIRAEQQYQHALKVAPNDVMALLSYAHLLDRQNKLDQATQIYTRAVNANPREAAAHNDLGLCYARRRMMNESAAELAKAVELQPTRELYRNNLATVLAEQNRADEALKQLQAVQADAVAHYNVGCLLHNRGYDQLAATYFDRAAQLDPQFAAAHHLVAQVAASAPPIVQPATAEPIRMAAVPASPAPPSDQLPTMPPPSATQARPPRTQPNMLRTQVEPPADFYLSGNRFVTQTAATAQEQPNTGIFIPGTWQQNFQAQNDANAASPAQSAPQQLPPVR
jgi:tetratricopeptide (TPR) repeat protein